ncbi:MAG TPA: LytTR family DNA-binding domain-containing protein [Burkholderiaceae bacterium]|nr:LytTR family DNA-binding domain-containing protein [Burkholderiaceae bacterium]
MSHTARAIIAEDEEVLRLGLRDALAELWPDLGVCALAEDGMQALRALEEHDPDILFLDIQMPGLTGLEVAQKVDGRCHVVFVTAFDDYAVSAFEQGAIDYVLKPLSIPRLATTVARLKQRLGSAPAHLAGLLDRLALAREGDGHLRWITASQGRELRLITVGEVCYFRSDNKYTLVVTADGEALIRMTLRELIDQLDPAMFWQVHRHTVVNANAIASLHREINGRLYIKLKQRSETLVVSESHAARFRTM